MPLARLSLYFTILLSGWAAQVSATELHGIHCPLGCPGSPQGNELIVYHLFTFSNNPGTKFADWVAYEVESGNFGVSPGRNFKKDPLLDGSMTLEKGDYKDASSDVDLQADKGHQAPLASFARSVYWYETNYLSNITPQDKDLNQGPWKALEEAVRGAVEYKKPLYVITGPTYEGERRRMPGADEEHDVPDGYFKLVYTTSGGLASFWMPQSAKRSDNYCDYRKPIEELQGVLGFDFPDLQLSTALIERLGC